MPPPVQVPTPRPDRSAAVIAEGFTYLVSRAVQMGVIPAPAVYQDIDEWLGAELAGQFKLVCHDIFAKLGGSSFA